MYINEHLTEELSVDKLAEAGALSRYYLMHKFKAMTGYSIHQYVTSKRLMLAKSLLASTDDPIADVAFQCGFNDYSSFSREFKKAFSLTPKGYRKGL